MYIYIYIFVCFFFFEKQLAVENLFTNQLAPENKRKEKI